jgi:DNA-directed RNA polymerase specialized sigma24 family protein
MPRGQSSGRLTADAFALLLARLHPDPERAGEAYEALRLMLAAFFAWRGAATPEECADETLDRLAAKLAEGVVIDDVRRFARGVARLVLLEHWRGPAARRGPLDDAVRAASPAPAAEEEEHRYACLERCLAELPADGRTLILRYYASDGRDRIESRRRLAAELGVSESALRNRAQRLRDRLEQCLTARLADMDA